MIKSMIARIELNGTLAPKKTYGKHLKKLE
jgi:hypothetical protein